MTLQHTFQMKDIKNIKRPISISKCTAFHKYVDDELLEKKGFIDLTLSN